MKSEDTVNSRLQNSHVFRRDLDAWPEGSSLSYTRTQEGNTHELRASTVFLIA